MPEGSHRREEIATQREELRQRLASWTWGLLNLLGMVLLAIIIVRFAVNLSPAWASRLDRLSAEIWIIFVVDFVIQFVLAPHKWQFLRHNWLLALSVVLPAFRVLRVVPFLLTIPEIGLARGLALANRATRTLEGMLHGHQFGRAMLLTLIVTIFGAAGLVYFQGEGPGHFGDAMWWSAAFVTTIGSNFQPTTVEAKIVSLLLVVWGLGVLGYVTATIASYFVGNTNDANPDAAEQSEIKQLRQDVAELKAMLAQVLAEQGGAPEAVPPEGPSTESSQPTA